MPGTLAVFLAIAQRQDTLPVGREELDELPARTHQPEIVKCEDNGHARRGRHLHDGRGQVVQMLNVDHVGAECLQDSLERPVHRFVPVAVAEMREIEEMDGNRPAQIDGVFHPYLIRWQERVFEPGEYFDLMPGSQCPAECLSINLRASVVARRVTVDYLEYVHVNLSELTDLS
jgi:hypothetical protein